MRSQVQGSQVQGSQVQGSKVQDCLSVGSTESEFTTVRQTAGEVQGCLFHALTGFQPLVGFNVVFLLNL